MDDVTQETVQAEESKKSWWTGRSRQEVITFLLILCCCGAGSITLGAALWGSTSPPASLVIYAVPYQGFFLLVACACLYAKNSVVSRIANVLLLFLSIQFVFAASHGVAKIWQELNSGGVEPIKESYSIYNAPYRTIPEFSNYDGATYFFVIALTLLFTVITLLTFMRLNISSNNFGFRQQLTSGLFVIIAGINYFWGTASIYAETPPAVERIHKNLYIVDMPLAISFLLIAFMFVALAFADKVEFWTVTGISSVIIAFSFAHELLGSDQDLVTYRGATWSMLGIMLVIVVIASEEISFLARGRYTIDFPKLLKKIRDE
ncbi:MAG TPA: hypothetical protein PKB15_05050 [Acidimicrobiia bacterium]|nr:hypothetical protein [Acidimicrobiia bacterium]